MPEVFIISKSELFSNIFLTINLVLFNILFVAFKFLKSITTVPPFKVSSCYGKPVISRLFKNSAGNCNSSLSPSIMYLVGGLKLFC